MRKKKKEEKKKKRRRKKKEKRKKKKEKKKEEKKKIFIFILHQTPVHVLGVSPGGTPYGYNIWYLLFHPYSVPPDDGL